ncbi:E3 SUMO-protein ligase RanBP2 isoform X2 [Macrobrachium rosenbergii]|uniref:E3 SUMO-protein ligase RanBP2 isoform X2 n=1 Tax=Macrobrachium rosenbergii TaxID=79674 RepID=UPI0034D42127
MLRSKKDVDRHVRDILNKVRTEDERKVRGYNIARMYYNVGEYESARRYLSEFLSVRPKANDAHRLLGQIFESLNMKEKAVQAYKTAYELGEGQRDLVLKICELYCDVPCDASVRLYWADEGDRLFPHHENVIRLREAIISSSSTSSREELEKLYFDEIKANPLRVKLYTSLLQLYKDWKGKEKEAYKYGFQIEARKAFPDSLEWYQALCDSSEVYRNIADCDDVEFHRNYLSVLERLVYLTLASSSSTALLSQCTHMDASTLLHKFDQALMTSLKIVGEDQVFGKLMVGQLYMHMASILLHSSKKESLLQTNTSAGALLFHACRFRPSEGGHPSKSQTSQEQFWYKLACHRLSQAYHVLHHMAKTEGEKSQFLETIKQKISNTEAQANIFTTIFGSSYSNTMESSFFMNDDKFYTAVLAYPEPEQVKKWDSVVGSMYCSSLRDMVWLCIQQAPSNLKEPQPYYSFALFEGLQFSSNKINTGAAETLCHLDLLAFLVATVFCQKAASKDAHGPPPASLPTVVTSVLNTSEQAEWWNAAYTLFTNRAHHRLNKLRMILQRGLEVIRAIGNHGIDLILMAHLAQCFTKWAQIAKSDGSCRSEVEALEERAKHYWDCVLSLCQKVGRNTNTIVLRNRLFVVQSESLSPSEIEKVQEEGKYFLAMRLVHAGKKQEAIQALGNLKSPDASYERAMLYKEQAQGLLTESCAESLTPEMRSQYTSLLRQARDTLYLTLDRLRMPDIDRCHPLNTKLSQQLEDVEKRLSHITLNPDVSVQREDDTESLSDDSQSRLDLTNGHVNNGSQALHMFSTPVRDNRNGSRITRQEARPSPERLDAQVRALTEVQEHSLRNLEEQNSALRSQNEELRKLCATISKESNHSASMYREMLEQNKTCSQEALNSILTAIHNLQTHVLSIAEDLSEVVKAMKSGQKLLEKPDAKLEEQVPVELPAAAAVVPPGLNNYYVNYYDQQVPYYRPSPGFLRFPPFSPPSTLAEQSYSITTSVGQAPGVSTIAQASAAIVTPTPSSPATIVSKDPVPSSPATAGLSLAQGISHTNFSSLSWTMATTTSSTKNISGTVETTSAPAHNYQIAMPITCTALTPPPGSTPGEPLSLSLPCSTTGLLANVPPPLYSAVTPDSSPLRGQSKVHSLSTVLSPEGLTHATGSVEATSTSPNKDGSFIENLESTQASPTKGKDTDEEEHDPCPDYKPLIPLPEKVEVRTGEENEEVLFEDRAKLFRFIDKEWRERGTGVMKILHNSSQGTARVLMRRDQTHKVCANHLIHSTIDVQPMKNNDKAWMWAAQDYADEELRLEKFCCRFKTPEIAVSFQEAFLKAKEIAKTKEASGESKVESEKEKSNAPAPATGQKSLAEMFKPPEGSWNCETCEVNNTAESARCVACQTPKPNATKGTEVQAEIQKPFAAFKFTTSETPSATTSPVSFKIITGSAVSSTPTSVATSNIGSTPGFSLNAFGSSTTSTPTTSASVAASGLSSSTTTSFTEPSKDKFTLSGFSFFTPPSVIQEKADETQQKSQGEEKKKESVFANFTFGSMETKTTSASFSFTTVSDDKGGSVTSSPGLFSGAVANSAGNMATFASLASNTPEQGTNVFKITDSKAFEQKPLFGDSSGKSPSKDDGDDKDDEYEPQADFAPVVPLPDLVEVKTGEEEEVALFCERCKLFRYDTSNKEWKERGVGSLKILKNNTSGKVRILMRRDQVHKICANHFITADIKLTQMAASDKAWIWAANDFADEEMKYEKFAARFKTQELALGFKTAFESAQKSLDDAPQSSTVGVISSSVADDSEKQKAPLAEMFKPKAGSWECESCLVRNDSGAIVCIACSTKKPGSEGLKDAPEAVPQDKPVDPKTATLASLFKPPPGSWECTSCLVRNKAEDTVCAACGSGGSGTTVPSSSESKPAFKFGIKDTSTAGSNTQISSGGFSFSDTEKKPAFSFGISSTVTTAATQPSFSFGVPSQQTKSDSTTTSGKSTFSFGTQQTQSSQPFTFSVVTTPAASTVSTTTTSTTAASSTTAKDAKSSFVFGSPGKYDFTFSGVKAKSPRSRDISVCESEDGVVEEDDGDHLYFEPVIPLPEKVEVVTGEEDEIVLYCNRAKLHRLVAGEWKERGLGDIKVLEHKKTGKIRLLMRREQVHKICLNHNVEKGMEFRKKDDKTFFWATVDYAENTPKSETFAIRFKTPEIAVEFYKAVDNAKVKLGGKPTEVPIVLKSTPKSEETDSEKTNQGGALSASKTTFATADSTTPSSGAIGGTPKGSLFGGITGKSLFGSSLGTSGSLFGSPSSGQSFSEGLSAAAAAKPNEPNFTVNVSSSFSLKSPPTSTPYFAGGTQVFGKGSIEIIYEKKATPEQIERARSLKLPDNFFLYEDAAPCPGCRGCTEEDDQSFKGSKEQSPVDSKAQAAPSGSLFGNLSGSQTQIGSSTSLFGGSVKSGSLFGSSTPTSQGLFGGPKLFGGAVTTTASIFGGATTTTGSIFGTSSVTGSIFGGTTTTASIFGGTTTTGSMFGGTSTSSSPSIFGGATTTISSIIGGATTTPSGIFGKATTTPSIFGGTATTTGSIFGGVSSSPSIFGGVSSSSATTPTPSLFGTATSTSSNAFGSSTPTTTSSLFGGIASAKPKFFDSSSSGGLFSSSESGGFLSNKSSTSPSLFGGQPANTVSFGSIAKESTPSLEASQKGAGNSDGWLKKGQSVFSRLSPKKEGDGDGNESGAAIPDLAKLKTPDEDWEVIFCRRGKLFNYDASSKQWKERGVGDFKILTDSGKSCYRLSQKLEKDSKESCNHFLTSQMQLKPMMSSETAWCWNAVDYSGSLEGKEEQISIRFKTKDIAAEFKSKFVECQEKLGQPSENSSSTASATIILPQSNLLPKKEDEDDDDEEEEDEEEEEEDDDDDDDDEDDDDDDDEEEEDTENATLFLKRCTLLKKENGDWKTLGTGDLRIVYDDEYFGARIVMVADGGDTLAEHIIAIQTTMHKEGNSATWTVLNLEPSPATTVTFKAQFSSIQALEEFASAFSEGKEYAENSGIVEQPSAGGCEAPPEQLYCGQGADGQGAVHQNFGSVSYSSNLGKNSVPFSFGQIVTCDPNLTKEIAAAIEEYLPKESSNSESE